MIINQINESMTMYMAGWYFGILVQLDVSGLAAPSSEGCAWSAPEKTDTTSRQRSIVGSRLTRRTARPHDTTSRRHDVTMSPHGDR